MRKLVSCVFLILCLLPALSFGADKAATGGTLVWGRGGDSVSLDLAQATDGDEGEESILYIGPEVEERQLKRLQTVKHDRSDEAVASSLALITAAAADPTINTMPVILDAVRAYATVGEIVGALEVEFGRWTEPLSI